MDRPIGRYGRLTTTVVHPEFEPKAFRRCLPATCISITVPATKAVKQCIGKAKNNIQADYQGDEPTPCILLTNLAMLIYVAALPMPFLINLMKQIDTQFSAANSLVANVLPRLFLADNGPAKLLEMPLSLKWQSRECLTNLVKPQRTGFFVVAS